LQKEDDEGDRADEMEVKMEVFVLVRISSGNESRHGSEIEKIS
jgi:hypothetical protein